jgi:hypothetical protein
MTIYQYLAGVLIFLPLLLVGGGGGGRAGTGPLARPPTFLRPPRPPEALDFGALVRAWLCVDNRHCSAIFLYSLRNFL